MKNKSAFVRYAKELIDDAYKGILAEINNEPFYPKGFPWYEEYYIMIAHTDVEFIHPYETNLRYAYKSGSVFKFTEEEFNWFKTPEIELIKKIKIKHDYNCENRKYFNVLV